MRSSEDAEWGEKKKRRRKHCCLLIINRKSCVGYPAYGMSADAKQHGEWIMSL